MSASDGSVSASAANAGSSVSSLTTAASASTQTAIVALRGFMTLGRVLDQRAGGERLQRLPAVERVGIARREKTQVVLRLIALELDRRRETAVERDDRALVDAGEHERLDGIGQGQHAALRRPTVGEHQRQFTTVGVEQCDDKRDDQRLLDRLSRGRRRRLPHRERAGVRDRVVVGDDLDVRRAGLAGTSA